MQLENRNFGDSGIYDFLDSQNLVTDNQNLVTDKGLLVPKSTLCLFHRDTILFLVIH